MLKSRMIRALQGDTFSVFTSQLARGRKIYPSTLEQNQVKKDTAVATASGMANWAGPTDFRLIQTPRRIHMVH